MITQSKNVKSKLLFVLITGAILGATIHQSSAQTKDFKEAEVFITAESTNQLLSNVGFTAFDALEQPDENYPTIFIDPDKTFQTIEGFGGAFTDAAAVTFSKLPADSQEKILKACFDQKEGNAYTLCRTTIHSCDYSDEMYTYDDVAGDKDLKKLYHSTRSEVPYPLNKKGDESC